MTSKIEIQPRTVGEMIKNILDDLGVNYEVSIDRQNRVSVTIKTDLTQTQIDNIKSSIPNWLKYQYDIKIL